MEIAWGDQGYYMDRDFSLTASARALLWPTPSVLHVVYLDKEPSEYFADNPIKRLGLCRAQMELLYVYLQNSFRREEDGALTLLGDGLYGDSHFYRANESYHCFYTCNSWLAKGLRKIGINTPVWGATAPAIMFQIAEN